MRWFTYLGRVLGSNSRQRRSRGIAGRPRRFYPQVDGLENRWVPSGFHGALGHLGAAAPDMCHVHTMSAPKVLIVSHDVKDDSGEKAGVDANHKEGIAENKTDLPSPDLKGKDDSADKSKDQSPDNIKDTKNDSQDTGSSQDQSRPEDSSQSNP